MSSIKHPSSYRDPSGFLYYHNNILYRQVNRLFKDDFEQFISGGLYQHLVDKELLISHQMIGQNYTGSDDWYQTLQPQIIPFVSYPYEWCFDMLKDAALLTLEVAHEAIEHGMMLKDASAYNVQCHKGRMIFIDTLSFETYDESKPWIAYRQFCEHFLAPLTLMHYLKLPLQQLFLAYPEGIPLTFTKKLLPVKSNFSLNVFLHLHLHASIASGTKRDGQIPKAFSSGKLKNLLKSLRETVQSFSLNTPSGVWSGYYKEAMEREDYVVTKKRIIEAWVQLLNIKTAIDIGANEGEFSMILAQRNIYTISADSDHYSINNLYKQVKEKGIQNILPLVIDFANPSPSVGLNNEERTEFLRRAKIDLVLALAVMHHLVIGRNIPFESIAKMCCSLGEYLIVEFVPKEDEKVRLMLEQKKDIYHDYSEENFISVFERYFSLSGKNQLSPSNRTLYLFKKNG